MSFGVRYCCQVIQRIMQLFSILDASSEKLTADAVFPRSFKYKFNPRKISSRYLLEIARIFTKSWRRRRFNSSQLLRELPCSHGVDYSPSLSKLSKILASNRKIIVSNNSMMKRNEKRRRRTKCIAFAFQGLASFEKICAKRRLVA